MINKYFVTIKVLATAALICYGLVYPGLVIALAHGIAIYSIWFARERTV
jgi:hypothetical protein